MRSMAARWSKKNEKSILGRGHTCSRSTLRKLAAAAHMSGQAGPADHDSGARWKVWESSVWARTQRTSTCERERAPMRSWRQWRGRQASQAPGEAVKGERLGHEIPKLPAEDRRLSDFAARQNGRAKLETDSKEALHRPSRRRVRVFRFEGAWLATPLRAVTASFSERGPWLTARLTKSLA